MIKIAIIGYGNLGKGVESAIRNTNDMELFAIFSRRNPLEIQTQTGVDVFSLDSILDYKDKIDVVILCGGSANDLPTQTVEYAKYFNVVDSYDKHAEITNHYNKVNKSSIDGNKVSIISTGWDPGLFSIQRLYAEAILPNCCGDTFWGKGVSQGHSDAIRQIDGVEDAKQYTIPKEEAIQAIQNGERVKFTAGEKHIRECYVVAKDGANTKIIEEKIKKMPNYFEDFETIVHFITKNQLNDEHAGIPHGGIVTYNGKTGINNENNEVMEFKLNLDSNPEFTASVLVAYSRAAYRLANEGIIGCKTVFEIAPIYLHPENKDDLIIKLL